EHLELATVLKISQAVSGEIVLEHLQRAATAFMSAVGPDPRGAILRQLPRKLPVTDWRPQSLPPWVNAILFGLIARRGRYFLCPPTSLRSPITQFPSRRHGRCI